MRRPLVISALVLSIVALVFSLQMGWQTVHTSEVVAQGMGGSQYMGPPSRAGGTITNPQKEQTIFEPDSVNDEIAWFRADAKNYPNGIKIVYVSIQLPGDAAYTMGIEEWSGDPPSSDNTIENVSTGASDNYAEVLDADIDDQTVAADKWVYLDIPDTDVDWVTVTCIYYGL